MTQQLGNTVHITSATQVRLSRMALWEYDEIVFTVRMLQYAILIQIYSTFLSLFLPPNFDINLFHNNISGITLSHTKFMTDHLVVTALP